MPEDSDSDFSWRELVRRNNDELVATYGNLVHRVLTITFRNFDGRVPTPGELDGRSNDLLGKAQDALVAVDDMLYRCRFRESVRTIMALAQEANRYLDEKEPWKRIKEDRDDAATSLYVVLRVISHLKTLFAPFLPFTSQRLHNMLGFDGSLEDGDWSVSEVQPGQRLSTPQPLFIKLDDSIVEQEDAKLGAAGAD